MCTPKGREFMWAYHEKIDLLTWTRLSVVWAVHQGSGRGALFFYLFHLQTSKTLLHHLLATVVNMHWKNHQRLGVSTVGYLKFLTRKFCLFVFIQGGLLSDGSSHSPGLWTSYTLHLFVQHSKPHTWPFAKVLIHLIILLTGTHLKHLQFCIFCYLNKWETLFF